MSSVRVEMREDLEHNLKRVKNIESKRDIVKKNECKMRESWTAKYLNEHGIASYCRQVEGSKATYPLFYDGRGGYRPILLLNSPHLKIPTLVSQCLTREKNGQTAGLLSHAHLKLMIKFEIMMIYRNYTLNTHVVAI